jgi:hypothetical protein
VARGGSARLCTPSSDCTNFRQRPAVGAASGNFRQRLRAAARAHVGPGDGEAPRREGQEPQHCARHSGLAAGAWGCMGAARKTTGRCVTLCAGRRPAGGRHTHEPRAGEVAREPGHHHAVADRKAQPDERQEVACAVTGGDRRRRREERREERPAGGGEERAAADRSRPGPCRTARGRRGRRWRS